MLSFYRHRAPLPSTAVSLSFMNQMFFPLAACTLLLASVGAQAQTVNLGDDVSRPMPGSGHDYIHLVSETVSPSNGNVEIKIDLPVAPARGFTLPFALTYESGEAHRFSSNGPGCGVFDVSCVASNSNSIYGDRAQAGHGWSDTLPYVALTLQDVVITGAPYYIDTLWCPISDSYNFYDAAGGSHMLGLAALGEGTAQPGTPVVEAGCSQIPYGRGSYNYFHVPTGGDDQVFAQMDADCNGDYQYLESPNYYPSDCIGGAPAFTVIDLQGTTYSFPANSAAAPSPNLGSNIENPPNFASIFPSQIEDRNGNITQFTFTPNQTSSPTLPVIDSLGRTHISSTPNGNGTTTYTVDGLQYVVGYTTETANYTVGDVQINPVAGVACNFKANVVDSAEPVIKTITLPNGQFYNFKYDPTYGLVSEIDYPDGGWVQYTWGLTQNYSTQASYDGLEGGNGVYEGACNFEYQTPAILTRTVGYGPGAAKQIQSFSYLTAWNSSAQWTSKTSTVVTKDVATGTSATTIYTYSPIFQPSQPNSYGQLPAMLPVESTVTQTDWGSSASLTQTTKTWADQFEMLSESTVLSGNASLTSKKTYCYFLAVCADPSGFPQALASVTEYDFGQTSPTRKTSYSYYQFAPPCLLPNDDLPPTTSKCGVLPFVAKQTGFAPSKILVTDGSGNRLSETDAYYDGMTPTSGTVVAVVATDVTGLAATVHDEALYSQPSTQARSNVTEVVKWESVGASPTILLTFDKTGHIRTTTDPCVVSGCSDMAGITGSNIWSYSYADSWDGGPMPNPTNAYLTSVKDPLGHTTSYQYAWSDGQLTRVTDPNGQLTGKSTTYLYSDSLRRMTNVGYPDGGATALIYNDSAPSVETEKTLNSSGTLVTTLDTYDGMGHVLTSSLTSDPFTADTTTMTYNGMGQVFTKTNPERSTPFTSDGKSIFYYDFLGRPIQTIEQDGSTRQWCYNGATSWLNSVCASSGRLGSATNGTWVDSWDELGNHSQHVSDSFGRLTQVMEPNGTSQSPSMETDYGYDLLNNLTAVTQWGGASGSTGARGRQFTYDSLSRLSTSLNPESGKQNYYYDLNGNLSYKTSPAVNVPSTSPAQTQTISYCYDALNRPLYRFYSSGAPCSAPSNPAAAYTYDTISGGINTIGRITSASSYSGSTLLAQSLFSTYDTMGRLQGETQCTLVNCAGTRYNPSYTYDYLGNVLTASPGLQSTMAALGTTPLQITSQYDAAGRLKLVTSNVPDAVGSNYPSTLFSATSTTPAAYSPVGLALASIGIDQNSGLATGSTSRIYDEKERPISEVDSSNANGNFGIIQLGGQEQSASTNPTAGTAATAQIVVQGGQPYNGNSSGQITVGSVSAPMTFSGTITPTYVAQQIANAINNTASMPATAQAQGVTVIVIAKTTGVATDYPLYFSTSYLGFAVTVPASMTGGVNSSQGGTVYDAGTVSATLGGQTATYAWGQNDNTSTISSGLAAAMNVKFNGTLTATPGDGVITLSGNFAISTSVTYNTTVFASPSYTAPYKGSIIYVFDIASAGGYDTASNIKGVTDTVTGTWAYKYDSLNRLSTGVASSGSYKGDSGCWAYDPWGNRTAEVIQPTACPASPSSLTPTAAFSTANRVTTATVNAIPNVAFTYDQAGNVLYDGSNNYLYDTDGRLCAVESSGGSITGYLYDTASTRVNKGTLTSLSCNLATNGFIPTASYQLGLGGEQVSELAVSGTKAPYASTWVHTNVFAAGKLIATYNGSETYFAFTDWLGTKRVEITPDKKQSGYFNLPYGNQLIVSGTAADATEQHFTGKERDAESGLDYFGARYYGSSMGRFMSPDPVGGSLSNPQSLNRYAYVVNNPLRNVDPTGLDCVYKGSDANDSMVVRGDCFSDDDDGVFVDGHVDSLYDQGSNIWANVSGYTDSNDPYANGTNGDVFLPGMMDQWNGSQMAQQVFQGPGSGAFGAANTVVNYAAAGEALLAGGAFFAPEIAAGVGAGTSWAANASGALGPATGRVFWSAIGSGAAADWAEQNGGSTLEMTPLGSVANWAQGYLPQNGSTGAAWNALSSGFASGAQGSVTYLQGARLGSTWLNTELPILEKQGNPIITVPIP